MMGSNHLKTPNEPDGLEIWFYFKDNGTNKAVISVEDSDGNELYKQEIDAGQGIRKIYWNTGRANPGEYLVKMNYNNKTLTQKARVEEAWRWPVLNYRE